MVSGSSELIPGESIWLFRHEFMWRGKVQMKIVVGVNQTFHKSASNACTSDRPFLSLESLNLASLSSEARKHIEHHYDYSARDHRPYLIVQYQLRGFP